MNRTHPTPHIAALQYAQDCAERTGQAHGVWEHVGRYGHPAGDIARRPNAYKVQSFDKPDPADDWALVACVDPHGTPRPYCRCGTSNRFDCPMHDNGGDL